MHNFYSHAFLLCFRYAPIFVLNMRERSNNYATTKNEHKSETIGNVVCYRFSAIKHKLSSSYKRDSWTVKIYAIIGFESKTNENVRSLFVVIFLHSSISFLSLEHLMRFNDRSITFRNSLVYFGPLLYVAGCNMLIWKTFLFK